MKLLRNLVCLVAVLLMGGGFVASEFAALGGTAQDYAAKVDQPPIRLLALVVLVGAVALAFVRDTDTPEQGDSNP